MSSSGPNRHSARHISAVEGFIRAYKRSVDFLYDPANRPIAEALLVANIQMSPEIARRAYDVLLDARSGFYRDVGLDPAAIRTVLALRSKYGQPRKTLADPARYIDLSYRERALASSAAR